MKKLAKLATLAMAFTLALGTLSGCSSSSSTEAGVVRVGFMPYYASVPLQVIQDNGLDEKYGFEMETVMFASGGPMAEALGAGEWDIGQIGAGGMSAIPNYNAKLIADVQSEMDGTYILARSDSPVIAAGANVDGYPEVLGDAASVEGLTILCTVGNISHYMALDYIQKMGLDIADVDIVHMETATIANAFISGEGDLACFGDPTACLQLAAEDEYTPVGGLKKQGISQQDAMLVGEDFYESNQDDIVNFMMAWYEACELLNADEEYEYEMAMKFYTENGRTVDESTVRQEIEISAYTDPSNFYDREVGLWMTGLIECYVSSGTMEETVLDALKENIDTSLAEQAMEQMG
ncbi:ABC transporter substrate-binding protein [Bengtsoniella intestinalis]|uniref:ABC transporter substrate-binding protein n=1 Tax=Bengtsoniella intestinalis TaxID=3073143 RepID=UPI00391F1ED2